MTTSNNKKGAPAKAPQDATAIRNVITVVESEETLARIYKPIGGFSTDIFRASKVSEHSVSSLEDVLTVLEQVRSNPRATVVQGAYVGDVKATKDDKGLIRPDIKNFEDRYSNLIIFSVGINARELNFDAALVQLVGCLPERFHCQPFLWQLVPGKLPFNMSSFRAYLVFWMAEPMTLAQVNALIKEGRSAQNHDYPKSPVSTTTMIHIATPVFEGWDDPIPVRWGYVQAGGHSATPLGIPMTDFLTALTSYGPVLTKTYKADGSVESYDDAKSFNHKEVPVTDIRDLSAKLTSFQGKEKVCVIRGKLSAQPEVGEVSGSVRRTNVSFDDCPHHWLMIDIDKYAPGFADPVTEVPEAVQDFLEDANLQVFKGCSFHWQLSSSAGMKPGILKCHVWFWSETAYTSAQMYAWAQRVGVLVDKAVYRRVQIHYTANPIFEEGRTDPVAVRSGFYQGARDTVPLTLDGSVLESARVTASGKDTKLVDPSDKEGLVGAYHRVFDAHTVLMEHLEGMFEPGVNDRRWTWLDGGGTPEGVWVHDDGMHVHATHNTWPFDGIVNLWDLVRVLKFGDKDTEGDDFDKMDAASTPIQGRPSNLAMIEWVKTLPEMQEDREEQAIQDKSSALTEGREMIRSAPSETTLRYRICPELAGDLRIDAATRDALAVEVNDRLGALCGKKPGISSARKLLLPDIERALNAPDWLKDVCYVSDQDRFFKYDTQIYLTHKGFNAKYSRKMRAYADERGNVPIATDYAGEMGWVDVVTRALYLPSQQQYFALDGTTCVNTYRPSSVPPAADIPDAAAVALVHKHIMHLCSGRSAVANHLLDWLAHNIQHPGVKIRHSPVIQGIEGDGKSLLGTILGATMGEANVGVIAPEVINESNFTGWAEGRSVAILEEIRIAGLSRHELLNKVKPLITNDTIQIHRKGIDPYNAPNTANYIAFTNHKDALPVSDTDRRWFVIFTPWANRTDFEVCVGQSADQYFDALHAAIHDHWASLRRWLLDRDLTAFKRHSPAPDTEEKAIMVSMGGSDEVAIARMLIEEGGVGFNGEIVATRALSRAFEAAGHERPNTNRMNHLVAQLGYRPFTGEGKVAKQVKWRGEAHRVWTKTLATREEDIRRRLDATEKAEVEKDFSD